MSHLSRFECASSSLTLRGLLKRTQRALGVCCGLGIVVHLSFLRVGGLEPEQKVAKPLTTQFVKRQPRLTKPLELKKRPRPKRRQIQRQMVAVKARMERGKTAARFGVAPMLGGLVRPDVRFGRIGGFTGQGMEPHAVAAAIQPSRETEGSMDMALELLDIEALDTGKHHALVV